LPDRSAAAAAHGRNQRARLSAKIEVVAAKLVRQRDRTGNGIRNVVVPARAVVDRVFAAAAGASFETDELQQHLVPA
jgi:hypothetical protein